MARPEPPPPWFPCHRKCFHEKDQLNHRYHAKRALYLGELARALAASPPAPGASARLAALDGDARRPALLLAPRGSAPPFAVRLLPALPPGAFPLRKLAPSGNNLRSARAPGGGGEAAAPTPMYNAGMLADMMAARHAAHLQALFARLPCLKDALLLLKVTLPPPPPFIPHFLSTTATAAGPRNY